MALMTENKVISLRIFMPEKLRNEFKSVCARQGKNMSEVVTEFVEIYVKENDYSKQIDKLEA
jgi:metal-responsive CopG/Arc/MetJ family transcriptional regulator